MDKLSFKAVMLKRTPKLFGTARTLEHIIEEFPDKQELAQNF
jgi:hypothetical protein